MRKLLIALLVALVLSVPSRASAEPIAFTFDGNVTGTFNNLEAFTPGIAVGTPLVGSLLYETDPFLQFFVNRFDLYVGDFHFYGRPDTGGLTGQTGFFVAHSPIQADGPIAKLFPGDYMQLQFDLNDTTSPVGSLVLYGLDLFCQCGTNDTPGFTADLNSVTRVPESASTFGLMALGLIGVTGYHQAARRSRSKTISLGTRRNIS